MVSEWLSMQPRSTAGELVLKEPRGCEGAWLGRGRGWGKVTGLNKSQTNHKKYNLISHFKNSNTDLILRFLLLKRYNILLLFFFLSLECWWVLLIFKKEFMEILSLKENVETLDFLIKETYYISCFSKNWTESSLHLIKPHADVI